MDESLVDQQGHGPLAEEFQRIDAVGDVPSLIREIASLQSKGANAAFAVGTTQDARNSTAIVLEIEQGGLGLPGRDYYFKSDEPSTALRSAYKSHVARVFALAGDDAEIAAARAGTVLAIETSLAGASMTRAQAIRLPRITG